MDDQKRWWESKTVWGAVVTLVSVVAGFAGAVISADDQASLIDLLSGAGAAIGGLLALMGRLVAKSRIA